jgi:hypothetical protein
MAGLRSLNGGYRIDLAALNLHGRAHRMLSLKWSKHGKLGFYPLQNQSIYVIGIP